jgi:hypothetical protein
MVPKSQEERDVVGVSTIPSKAMASRLSCLRIQVPHLNHARATDKQPKDTTAIQLHSANP